LGIGVNGAGDAGDISPPIFEVPGISYHISPPPKKKREQSATDCISVKCIDDRNRDIIVTDIPFRWAFNADDDESGEN